MFGIKTVGVLLGSLLVLSASAQEFKPFKVNVSLGYAAPIGEGAAGGLLFSVEPKYGINDQIDLGLRLETAVVAQAIDITGSGNTTNGTLDLKALGSFLLTGNYLFSTGGFRPYLGAGVGVFNIAATSVTITNGSGDQSIELESASKLGGLVRAGFKASHFNFGVEYNIVGNGTAISIGTSGGSTVATKNSYLGVKVGIDIGGGRR